MKIIDAHFHLGDPGQMRDIGRSSPLGDEFPCYRYLRYDPPRDIDRMIGGYAGCTLVPSVFREHDRLRENQRVAEYAQGRDNLYPFYVIDEGRLEHFAAHAGEYAGLKEHILLHDSALNPVREAYFALAHERDMVLLLHTWADRRVTYIRSIVERFPGVRIQVAHMGRDGAGTPSFIESILEELRPYEHVFFDTSTVRSRAVLEKAVSIVGENRILYGSDYPFYMAGNPDEDIIEAQIQHVLQASLPQRVKDKILYGNFLAYYKRSDSI